MSNLKFETTFLAMNLLALVCGLALVIQGALVDNHNTLSSGAGLTLFVLVLLPSVWGIKTICNWG